MTSVPSLNVTPATTFGSRLSPSGVDGSLATPTELTASRPEASMILSAIAAKLKSRSKDDFKGRHFEAGLIVQAVSWYLRYPLSYQRRHRADHQFRPLGHDARPLVT